MTNSEIPESTKPKPKTLQPKFIPLVFTGYVLPDIIKTTIERNVVEEGITIGLYPKCEGMSQTLHPLLFDTAIIIQMNSSGQIVCNYLYHSDPKQQVMSEDAFVVENLNDVFDIHWPDLHTEVYGSPEKG